MAAKWPAKRNSRRRRCARSKQQVKCTLCLAPVDRTLTLFVLSFQPTQRSNQKVPARSELDNGGDDDDYCGKIEA